MAKTPNEGAKKALGEEKAAEKAKTLYQALEAASEKALSRGDHKAYSTLHPIVVALAGVKFAASQAIHEHVDEAARELLNSIKAL